MYKTLTAPISVQIELTDDCVQVCGHCYRACQQRSAQPTKSMNWQQLESTIRQLADSGVIMAGFTGGEPMMYKDLVRKGISLAYDLGLECHLNSTLIDVDEEFARFLADRKVAILTSLMADNEDLHDTIVGQRGSFRRICGATSLLSSHGASISVNMVVRKDNWQRVFLTGKLAKQLGAIRFSATKASPSPGTRYEEYRVGRNEIISSLDQLLEVSEELDMKVDILETYPFCLFGDIGKYYRFARRNCTAGVFNCTVGPDGDVRPCSHADMSYGNINTDSLKQAWSNMDEWRNGSLINLDCKECLYLRKCSGGCRMDAKHTKGKLDGRDPLMTNEKMVMMPKSLPDLAEVPALLRINPRARMREEGFGGLIKVDDEIVLLNNYGYNYLRHIKEANSTIVKDEVTCEGVSPEELDKFFKVLYNRRILTKGEAYA